MKVKFAVTGLQELDASLGQLSKATARNTLRRVLLRAGEPIAATARDLAPDDPATNAPDLKTSIEVSTKFKNAAGNAEFAAAMRAGLGRVAAAGALRAARVEAGEGSFAEVYIGPTKDGAHGVLQEFGTDHHGPQPFMRPAWDQKKVEALNIIKRDLGDEIEKAAKRAARRAARKAARG